MNTNGANTVGQIVINTVARLYNLDPVEVKTGKGPARLPRQVVMFLLKEADLSNQDILDTAGVKTMPSVYQAMAKVKGLITKDKGLLAKIEEVRTEILTQTVSDLQVNNGSSAGDRRDEPAEYRIPLPRRASEVSKGSSAVMEAIQEAVSVVVLGNSWFRAADPVVEVLRAKDTAVFYAWLAGVPVTEILEGFNIPNPDAFHASIGKITVHFMGDSPDFQAMLAKIRNKIPAPLR